MSERQPLKRSVPRREITEEQYEISDGICGQLCKYLKVLMCVGAGLLIVYLIFSFIGGINGVDYLPKMNIKKYTQLEESISHKIGNDPFNNWEECNVNDNQPSILAYHIHGIFDGTDKNSINVAMNAFYSFINEFNPNMKQCSFSHSNSATYQKELCYFPRNFKDDDFPMASNKIFSSTNYAFYVPTSLLQESLTWWMQHHLKTLSSNEIISFDYVVHSVSGCQINDHTKWLVESKGYDYQIIKENLLCCHMGPSACTCDIATYKIINDDISDDCLSISFDQTGNTAQFTMDACEEWTSRGLGSWREVTYSSDSDKNWFQIENYGDLTEPMYMCLTVNNNDNNDDNDDIKVGSNIILSDCSLNQNIENNEWISNKSKFKWNDKSNQIMFIGNNNNVNNEKNQLCINVETQNKNEKSVKLTLQSCNDATVFERSFTP